MSERFPILMPQSGTIHTLISELTKGGAPCLIFHVPWDVMTPHEKQADKNHYQTLAGLARRGGLAASEAVAVLEDRPWHAMTLAAAYTRLHELAFAGRQALKENETK